MMRPRANVRLYLVLLILLMLPAGIPPAAAQPALAETWIAFTSLAPGEEGIWMVHPDGSGLGQLTKGRDLYPTWSPDGKLLAYVHEISGTLLYGQTQGYNSEIRIVDTAGRIRYTIGQNAWVEGEAATPLAGNVGTPQWSPDGQALSYGVDLGHFVLVAWGGRRTFYLSPPRIEVGYGPQGALLSEGTVMLDQTWAPGPVPTWVRSRADLTTCQVMAYDRPLLNTTTALYFNPRWSPDGKSLTVYQQANLQDQFSNALLQINASGKVERTLLESKDLYLYTTAEPSPDGQRHLIGVSSEAPVWFMQALAGMFQEPGGVVVLPQTPAPTGYLYLLDRVGARAVVAQPQPSTVDLVSRQPWSPDGSQVVFMRAPHPAVEGGILSGLGIYVGPPGQTRRLVPFSNAQLSFELTIANPVWQPAPQGPLPTMVPLAPVVEPTAEPMTTPTRPALTATPTLKPTPSSTATPSPVPTPRPTAAPTPAAPTAPQSNLRTYLLIGIGVLVLALVAVILWTLLKPERSEGGAPSRRLADSLGRLLQPRRVGGEPRNPFRPLQRRSRPSAEAKPRAAGSLLRRSPQPSGAAAPKQRFALFSRRPQPSAGAAAAQEPAAAAPKKATAAPAPRKRFALFSRRPEPASTAPVETAAEPSPAPVAPPAEELTPEAAFPSLRPRREAPADWPAVDRRPTPAGPAEPAAESPGGLLETSPSAAPLPARSIPADQQATPVSPRQPPSPEQELLRQGIAQVRAGQAAAGMVTLQKVIQRAPQEGTAWLWLGWAAARQNQRVLAERCFVRARELGLGEAAEQALAWLRGRQG